MPRKGKRRRIATNIYADGSGLEAVARATVDGIELRESKRYPRDTKISEIRTWQRDTEVELRKLTGAVAKDTFECEVEIYLPLVREELDSFADRERHLRAWIPIFQGKKRHQIGTPAIDRQLRIWRNVDQLSASSVNQRRDAISDFFTKMNGGTEGRNPAKAAVWFARKKSTPKGIDRGRIWRVLEHMDPNRKTRWRLSLIHWTGMRPSQQGRLSSPDEFYLDDRAFQLEIGGTVRRVPAVLVPSGKGGDPVMFPLTPEGEIVARAFLRVDAFWRPPAKPRLDKHGQPKKPRQTWSCPSAKKRIDAAAKATGEPTFTVYTIKHSFASALRRTGTDLADIQDMLGHADIASTRIYAPAVQAKHVEAVDRLRADDERRYTPTAEGQPGPETVAPNRGTETDAA